MKRMTKKRQVLLDRIKTLADQVGVEVIWKDFEDAPYSALVFTSIQLQLASGE